MFGNPGKAGTFGFTGDWRAKVLAVAQIIIGFVALVAVVGMWTLHPVILFVFAFLQLLMLVGVVLFVIVAVCSQQTMVLETFHPGEVIFREGDPGRHVYVIQAGTVQVERLRLGSREPIVLKQLGPGDHFGEMALLRDARRNATVRTVTAVRAFRLSPGNFTALYTSLPGLRDHVNTLMQARLGEVEGPPPEDPMSAPPEARRPAQRDEVARSSRS